MKTTLHGVRFDISADHLATFFSNYGRVGDVITVKRKTGNATEGGHPTCINVPKMLHGYLQDFGMPGPEHPIVEGRRPHC